MKLIRFGEPGREKPGVILPDGSRIDVSAFGEDFDERFFATGGPERLQEWVAREGAVAPAVAAITASGKPHHPKATPAAILISGDGARTTVPTIYRRT